MVERFETIIIGGGQAGLSVGYHLAKRGHSFVILEALGRVGDNWRRHWDSLRLYSPARYDRLPGMPFPAPDWTFPTRDQMADYLQAYAERFELEVRHGVRVQQIRRNERGFVVDTGEETLESDNVVVAVGTFGGSSHVPAFASGLDPAIVQLHSSEYRNPAQLKPGPVLVVGASHSGADVAFEVATEHETVLSGPSRGQVPFPIEGKPARGLFPVLWFLATRVLTIRTGLGRTMRTEARHHGGPLLRVRDRDLAAAGVERVLERTVGVREGMPVLEGGRRLEVANVVWCTGFRHDLDWIDLPVAGDDGWPLEDRGVTPVLGLYFSGLAFQQSFSSMLVGGAGKDAEYVAAHIAARTRGGRSTVPSRSAA
ncbi:MAG: flavin-containing monooxygenase [Nocardioidaceae bacterium]